VWFDLELRVAGIPATRFFSDLDWISRAKQAVFGFQQELKTEYRLTIYCSSFGSFFLMGALMCIFPSTTV
jgi:hypothetical protein